MTDIWAYTQRELTALISCATLVAVMEPHRFLMSIRHLEVARPVHKFSLWVTTIMGLAVIAGGVTLVWLGATGHTEFVLFGNSFNSQSVGVTGILRHGHRHHEYSACVEECRAIRGDAGLGRHEFG